MLAVIGDDRWLAWYAQAKMNARLTERIADEMERRTGLPAAWVDVLANLKVEPRRMNELADDLILSRGGATRLIARMEEAGLVRREVPAHDRRATYAHVTDEGLAAFDRAMPIHMAKVDEYFHAHLTDEEIDVLTRAMAKVLRGLGVEDWLLEDLEVTPQ